MSRTVLITGCSSGIGKALAQAFCRNGDQVIATARRLEAMQDLQVLGCTTLPLDVNAAESRKQLRDALDAAGHRHLDLLIHNAGISAMGPLVELPEDQLRGQFETNVIAPVLLTQCLFELLRAAQHPVIVHVGSVSGILTTPFAGAYCASKAALHSIGEALRMELAPLGIQVVTVQPGGIQSNFGDAAAAGVQSWLSENSLYAPIRDGIMARAGASQVKATPAEDFAARLVAGLEGDSPQPVQRIGQGSRLLPALARCLPLRRRHRLLSRRFGLDRLGGGRG